VKSEPLPEAADEDFQGARFLVTRGDYSPLLKLVSDELRKAAVRIHLSYSKLVVPVFFTSLSRYNFKFFVKKLNGETERHN
jgi:hypothetical protein